MELLVVLGILLILAALLLPMANSLRTSAGGLRCANIMRQCAAGHMSYAMDNSGFLPFSSYGPDSTRAQRDGSWPYLIQSYTQTSQGSSTSTGGTSRTPTTTRCTSYPKEYLTSTLTQFDSGNGGLARNPQLAANSSASCARTQANDALSTGFKQFRVSEVTLPSLRMLLGHVDLGTYIFIDDNVSASYCLPGLTAIQSFQASQSGIWPAGTPTGTPGGNQRPSFRKFMTIHGQAMPYAFVDGHVQKIASLADAAKTIYNPITFK